jgi:hypothetical protein
MTGGIELRVYFSEDDWVGTRTFQGTFAQQRAAATAADFRLELLARGFSEIAA